MLLPLVQEAEVEGESVDHSGCVLQAEPRGLADGKRGVNIKSCDFGPVIGSIVEALLRGRRWAGGRCC